MAKKLLLLGLILITSLLRLFDLSGLPGGLHWDEQDTGYQAYSALKTGKDYFGNSLPLFFHSFADYRTPVFIYSAVPSVAKFGLTPLGVRLPSVVWSTVSVILIFILGSLLFGYWTGILSGVVLALSPWHLLYSHQSVECNSMLPLLLIGVIGFHKSLRHPGWLVISGLGFAGAIATYSPAKFFVPLLVLFLVISNFRRLREYPLKILVISVISLALSAPIYYDGFFGPSGTRFRDISIFTDPGLASAVNRKRQEHTVSSRVGQVGIQPSLFERTIINKATLTGATFIDNYARSLSLEYLFLRGDSEIRHSPSRDSIGQFYLVEIIPFLLGLFILLSRRRFRYSALLIFFWLFIGPIPSSLTRGGGPHAARTFLLLPAIVIPIAVGLRDLIHKSKFLFTIYSIIYLLSSLVILDYFHSFYRVESAKSFHWGYDLVINKAIELSPRYDTVVVDLKDDSGLMSYLFTTQLSPTKFQAMHPLSTEWFANNLSGTKFGNILLLNPDTRFWTNIFDTSHYKGNNVIVSRVDQPLTDRLGKIIETINYPDNTPAFIIFSK